MYVSGGSRVVMRGGTLLEAADEEEQGIISGPLELPVNRKEDTL